MARQLTKKQLKHVEAYAKDGIRVKTALEAGYDTDHDTARSMATENLARPNIIQEIEKACRQEAEYRP